MNTGKVQLFAEIGIIIITIIWGIAFVVVKDSLDLIPPVYMVAFRFTLAAIFLAVIFVKKLRLLSKQYLLSGAVTGIFLFLGYFLQTIGLEDTQAGVSAFLTTVYVVWSPFLAWLIHKKKPEKQCVAAAFIAVAGIGLLSLNQSFQMGRGEMLTLLCGVAFALHMVFLDKFAKEQDPILLTILQMAVVAILGWVLAPVCDGKMPADMIGGDGFWQAVLYLGLLSTGVAFLLQNVAQRFIPVTTTAILLSMESVFGALFSVLLLSEHMGGRKIVGCVLLFGAVITAQVKVQRGKASWNKP